MPYLCLPAPPLQAEGQSCAGAKRNGTPATQPGQGRCLPWVGGKTSRSGHAGQPQEKETEPLFYFRFFSNENGTWNLTISFTPFESESTGTKLPYSVTVGKTDDSTFSKPYEITNSGLKEQELESLTFGNSADVIYSFTYDLETAFNTGVALDDYEATITIGAYGP